MIWPCPYPCPELQPAQSTEHTAQCRVQSRPATLRSLKWSVPDPNARAGNPHARKDPGSSGPDRRGQLRSSPRPHDRRQRQWDRGLIRQVSVLGGLSVSDTNSVLSWQRRRRQTEITWPGAPDLQHATTTPEGPFITPPLSALSNAPSQGHCRFIPRSNVLPVEHALELDALHALVGQ